MKLSPPMKERLHEKLPNALIADTLLASEGGGAVADASVSRSHIPKTRFKIQSTGKFPVMVINEEGKFVKPGSRRGLQQAHHRCHDPAFLDEVDLALENGRQVGRIL